MQNRLMIVADVPNHWLAALVCERRASRLFGRASSLTHAAFAGLCQYESRCIRAGLRRQLLRASDQTMLINWICSANHPSEKLSVPRLSETENVFRVAKRGARVGEVYWSYSEKDLALHINVPGRQTVKARLEYLLR